MTSICINAETLCRHNKGLEQLTYALHQISRNACQYEVKEIVILGNDKVEESKILTICAILQYFITPKYLVKEVFRNSINKLPNKVFKKCYKMPIIGKLKDYLQGTKDNREGISIIKNIKRRKRDDGKVIKLNKNEKSTKFIQIGEKEMIEINEDNGIPLGVRVSINIKDKKIVNGEDIWGYVGYNIRIAKDYTSIFTEAGGDGYEKGILVKVGINGNDKPRSDLSKSTGSRIIYCFGCNGKEMEELCDEIVVGYGNRVEDAIVSVLSVIT